MHQVEIDCHLARLKQLSENAKPTYAYYNNDGWEFEGMALAETVAKWTVLRQTLLDNAVAMREDQMTLFTGQHAYFGEVNGMNILRMAAHHDVEHIRDLRLLIAQL